MSRKKPVHPPRERILTAALAAFAARGVGASSIQDVAGAAGMSKQALMHHFRTKDLLRAGVYELLAARLRDQLPEAAAELVSRSHDRYRGLIEVVLRRFTANPELSRFLLFELLERPAEVREWLREEVAPWLGLIRGVVAQSKEGRAAGLDAEAHLAVLGAMMLSQSALLPHTDRRWRQRTEATTLKIMLLGSHLA
ncbi:MAG: TetR/AcrR family transcriptional regulator [Archangium sp.]|nr:TetR/AcrR family transcriptional regulator [Archangium sp.]